jgi:hypothetical protein
LLIVYWIISQLLSYSMPTWIAFVAIGFTAVWLLRTPGVFIGNIIVALAVTALDVQWIQSEMHKPGWNGQPDQDFVFMIGVVLRVILVNVACCRSVF